MSQAGGSSEAPKKIVTSSVTKEITSKQETRGVIELTGDNFKCFLAADAIYQSEQAISIDIDNGRWQLEVIWSPTYRIPRTSDNSHSEEQLPLSLGIFLYSIRDPDERRKGGNSSRTVTFNVEVIANHTSRVLSHRKLSRMFSETTILSRSDSSPGTAWGWNLDAEALRRQLMDGDAVCIVWKLEETKDMLHSQSRTAVYNAPCVVASAASLLHLAAETRQSDLCFIFPPITSLGTRPYIHAWQILFRKIPYFEKAFAFEGPAREEDDAVAGRKKTRAKGARASNLKPNIQAIGPDRVELEAIADSDDETASNASYTTHLKRFSQGPPRSDERVIAVPDFSYRTYLALLEYVYTGHIVFAPLRSQYKGRANAGVEDSKQSVYPTYRSFEQAYVNQRAVPNTMTNPCSPKSMFRLANKLDIQELQSRALEEFKLQVTPYNVLDEMCSETVHLHKELLDVCTDCIIDNWDELAAQDEMLDALQHGLASDIPDVRQAWQKIFKSSTGSKKRKVDALA